MAPSFSRLWRGGCSERCCCRVVIVSAVPAPRCCSLVTAAWLVAASSCVEAQVIGSVIPLPPEGALCCAGKDMCCGIGCPWASGSCCDCSLSKFKCDRGYVGKTVSVSTDPLPSSFDSPAWYDALRLGLASDSASCWVWCTEFRGKPGGRAGWSGRRRAGWRGWATLRPGWRWGVRNKGGHSHEFCQRNFHGRSWPWKFRGVGVDRRRVLEFRQCPSDPCREHIFHYCAVYYCCGLAWLPQGQSRRQSAVAVLPKTRHKSAGPGNVNTAPEAHKSYQSRCTEDRETQTT